MSRHRKRPKEAPPTASSAANSAATTQPAGTAPLQYSTPDAANSAGVESIPPRWPLILSILLTAAWFLALFLLVIFTAKPAQHQV